jgi:hypothetical protein
MFVIASLPFYDYFIDHQNFQISVLNLEFQIYSFSYIFFFNFSAILVSRFFFFSSHNNIFLAGLLAVTAMSS